MTEPAPQEGDLNLSFVCRGNQFTRRASPDRYFVLVAAKSMYLQDVKNISAVLYLNENILT